MPISTDQFMVVSDTAPTDTTAKMWLETLDVGQNSFQLWIRSADDSTWLQASAGVSPTSGAPRQVGYYNGDPEDGNFIGLVVADGTGVKIIQTSADGNTVSAVYADTLGVMVQADGGVYLRLNNSGDIVFGGLPTSDPGVGHTGALYNDAGTLKISAGV